MNKSTFPCPGPGRNLLLNSQVSRTVCRALELGCWQKAAGAIAGISEPVLYRWLKLGRAALVKQTEGEPLSRREETYAQFAADVEFAVARCEYKLVKATCGSGSW